jgi:uncharacterized protein (DUF2336 family)
VVRRCHPRLTGRNNSQPEVSLETRKQASGLLISLLKDRDDEIRASAIRALSEAPVVGNDLPFARIDT